MVGEGIVALNLVGFLCPVPMHETRKAVEEAASGTLFERFCVMTPRHFTTYLLFATGWG